MFELKPAIEEAPGLALAKRLARQLPSLCVAALFIVVGYTKFDSDPRGEWVRIFERIGIGQWFRVVTGVVQVSGGVLLLWPRSRTVGAALLACTMVGAVIVDLFIIGSPVVVVPLMLLFLIVGVWATSQ